VTVAAAPLLEFDVRGRVGALAIEVALQLGPGRLLLAGPNGAGKTSVLGLLLGTLPATGGRIAASGRVLYDAGQGIDLPPEERGLGYVPQQYALFPQHTVLGNVAFGLSCQRPRRPRAQIEARARALLEALEIAHLEDRYPRTLSAGERQRVALARALAPEPRALLLDEPLAALDTSLRAKVRRVLADRLAALSLPALVVTHDPADAAALGERIAILEQGRIVQQGSLEDLIARPATPFAAGFAAGVEAARGAG
jgi:molybdate transport system ATP-binding protein